MNYLTRLFLGQRIIQREIYLALIHLADIGMNYVGKIGKTLVKHRPNARQRPDK